MYVMRFKSLLIEQNFIVVSRVVTCAHYFVKKNRLLRILYLLTYFLWLVSVYSYYCVNKIIFVGHKPTFTVQKNQNPSILSVMILHLFRVLIL